MCKAVAMEHNYSEICFKAHQPCLLPLCFINGQRNRGGGLPRGATSTAGVMGRADET